MSIVDNLKSYFNNKSKEVAIEKSPEGICPNCWGKEEWDGNYYAFMKGNDGNPSTETYNTFIQDVARKLDKITLDKNTYLCTTCKLKYE